VNIGDLGVTIGNYKCSFYYENDDIHGQHFVDLFQETVLQDYCIYSSMSSTDEL